VDVAVFQFGAYQLDLDARRLRRGGQYVHLEPRTFDLIWHLVSNRERVVPKQELREKVWAGQYVTDSALSTALRTARIAVGDAGERQEVIRTVYGRGYQFIARTTASSEGATTVTDESDADPFSLSGGSTAADVETIRFCHAEDGTRIAYASSGTGPPLVKAANWLTHLSLDRATPLFAHWFNSLCRNRRVIRYDERGGGMSEWCGTRFSPEDWVEDLNAVVADAGLDRFALLGIGKGAATAIAYAALCPERVSRMVLVSAYTVGRWARARTELERRAADVELELARIGWLSGDRGFLRADAAPFMIGASADDWDAYAALQLQTTSLENAIRIHEALYRMDVSDLARRVACPTLILNSRDDEKVPVSHAVELASLIPGSELTLLESRNHILTAAEPAWPDLVRLVDEFLADAPR
jgi:pimeloyl-ACP methyl ester carboxylesterase/DNA-binding winged helix-turn-helix (wHTH) protein